MNPPRSSVTALLEDMGYGPFAVGFKSMVLFDTSRTYDLNMGDTLLPAAPQVGRPIVVNVWYPAKATTTDRCRVRDFLNFTQNDTTRSFIIALKKYSDKQCRMYGPELYLQLDNMAGDTAQLEARRDQVYTSYMDLQTRSYLQAEPHAGTWPMAIYHQGLGGTMDEAWLLLEYLASHGIVGVSSAFQDPDDYIDIGVGNLQATVTDLGFLIDQRQRYMPQASDQVILMGHSFGANYIPCYIARGRRDVRCLVLLDNDLAHSIGNFFRETDDPLDAEHIGYLDIPIHCASRTAAEFSLLDRMRSAPRTYIRIDDMEHDQFTSLGALHSALSAPSVKEPAMLERAAGNYPLLCQTILFFIEHTVRDAPALKAEDIGAREGWWFRSVPPGETLPWNMPYDPSKAACPTRPQLVSLMPTIGPDSAGRILSRCEDQLVDTLDRSMEVFIAGAYSAYSTEELILFLDAIGEMEDTSAPFFLFYVGSMGWLYTPLPSAERTQATERAIELGKYIVERHPKSIYGPMMIILTYGPNSTGTDYRPYFEQLIQLDPDFLREGPGYYLEEWIYDSVQKFKEGK